MWCARAGGAVTAADTRVRMSPFMLFAKKQQKRARRDGQYAGPASFSVAQRMQKAWHQRSEARKRKYATRAGRTNEPRRGAIAAISVQIRVRHFNVSVTSNDSSTKRVNSQRYSKSTDINTSYMSTFPLLTGHPGHGYGRHVLTDRLKSRRKSILPI